MIKVYAGRKRVVLFPSAHDGGHEAAAKMAVLQYHGAVEVARALLTLSAGGTVTRIAEIAVEAKLSHRMVYYHLRQLEIAGLIISPRQFGTARQYREIRPSPDLATMLDRARQIQDLLPPPPVDTTVARTEPEEA